jgi:hypothetical protein
MIAVSGKLKDFWMFDCIDVLDLAPRVVHQPGQQVPRTGESACRHTRSPHSSQPLLIGSRRPLISGDDAE